MMGRFAVLIPAFLVILATVWALWLIFRKGDMVTQPAKVVMYFAGALIALLIAGCLMVVIFPAWLIQIWDYANVSPSVQSLQQRTEDVFNQTMGQSTATPRPPIVGPTPPVSPIASPGGGTGALSITPAPGQKTHVVQAGDTLFSIARRNGVSVQSLIVANNLANPDNIYPGQTLIIP